MRSFNAPAYIGQGVNVTKKSEKILRVNFIYGTFLSLSADSHGFCGDFHSHDPNDLVPVAHSDG